MPRPKSALQSQNKNINSMIPTDSLDTSINEIIEIQKPGTQNSTALNKFKSLESPFINSIDLFHAKSSTTSSSQNDKKAQEVLEKQAKSQIWRSSTNISLNNKIKPPSSALASRVINKTKAINQPAPRPPSADIEKSGLFLSYSKLIAIETSIQKQVSNENNEKADNRPKTANAKLNPIRLKFDLPTMVNPQEESRNSELKPDILSLGDQYVYSKLIEDNNKIQDEPVLSVDWQKLPHEIWLKILKFLKHLDLIQFGRTCKTFSNLYIDNSLCKIIYYFLLIF